MKHPVQRIITLCLVILPFGLCGGARTRITVRVSPERAEVPVGGSNRFSAQVRGTRNQDVRWSLSGDSGEGRISDEGVYFAPSSTTTPASVTVRATSAEDPSASATATIRIPEVAIQVQPTRTTLRMGETVKLKAAVSRARNPEVMFTVEGDERGFVSDSGVYSTPAELQTPTTVIVHAVSHADPTKRATARIDIGGIDIRVQPNRAGISVGGAAQFRASVSGTRNQDIVWSVLGGDQSGTVSESGLYRSPVPMVTPARVTVRAASAADPSQFSDAQVNVEPVAIEVSPRPPGTERRKGGGIAGTIVHSVTRLYLPFDPVSPILFGPIFRSKRGQLFLPAGGSYQFYARVTGTADDRVRWTIEGDSSLGTINRSGLYTAPDRLTTPSTVVIRATCESDLSKSALTSLVIPPIVVRAEPRTIQVLAGGTAVVKATVDNTENVGVEWRIEGRNNGRMTESGTYIAPSGMATPRTINLTAVSVADPTKEASVTIAVPAVEIHLSRTTVDLKAGETFKFSAKVRNAANESIVWRVEGDGNKGEISESGIFRAPARIRESKTVRVIAASAADPGKYVVAAVRIRP